MSVDVEGGASYFSTSAYYKTANMLSEEEVHFDSYGKAWADSGFSKEIMAVVGQPVTFSIYDGGQGGIYAGGWAISDGLYDNTAGKFVTGETVYDSEGEELGLSYTLTAGNNYTAKYHKVLVAYSKGSSYPYTVSSGCIIEVESDPTEAKPTITGFDGAFGYGYESYNNKQAFVADLSSSSSSGTITLTTFKDATSYYAIDSAVLTGYGADIIGSVPTSSITPGEANVYFSGKRLQDLLRNYKGQKLKLELKLTKKSMPYTIKVKNNGKVGEWNYSDDKNEWADGLDSVTDLNGNMTEVSNSDGTFTVDAGKKVKLYLKIKDNHELKGLSVNKTAVGEKDLKDALNPVKGYEFEAKEAADIEVTTEALKTVNVFENEYTGNPDKDVAYSKTKKGYNVDPYNKKAYIYFLNGSDEQPLSGNATDASGKDVTADTLTQKGTYVIFDGTKVPGQTITVKLTSKDLEEKDAELKFVVAKAGEVKISKTSDTMPVGATRTYKVKATGNIDYDLPYNNVNYKSQFDHFDFKWADPDKKTELVVTSKKLDKDENGKEYSIVLVDKNNTTLSTNAIAELKIKLETDTVKNEKAPGVAVKNTDINSMYVDLSNSVKELPIRGLYYAVTVTDTADHSQDKVAKKAEFVDSITRYFKVDGKKQTVYLSLLKPSEDTQANERLTDPTRKYKITAKLIQYNAQIADWTNEDYKDYDGTPLATPVYVDVFNNLDDEPAYSGGAIKYDAANLVIEGANETTVAKEVTMPDTDIYASKLKLKKVAGHSGPVYTNMTDDFAYQLSVDYGKGTTVRKITKVELINKDGTVIQTANLAWRINNDKYIGSGHSNNLDVTDEVIMFFPNKGTLNAPDCLDAGKYTIKAYAFEPLGIEVVGTAKVTVKQGIHELNVRSDSGTYCKKPGKALSFKAVAYDTTPDPDKITKKVTWEIDEVNSSTDIQKLIKSKGITIKNGKVTIKDKKFVPGNNTFVNVVATAKDWKGTTVNGDLDIRITNDNQNAISVYNTGTGFFKLKDGATYDVDTFFNDYGATSYGRYRTTLSFQDESGAWVSVKWKASGAASIVKGIFVFKKPGTFKITGTALDGSGRKVGPIKITIKAATGEIKYNLKGYLKDGSYDTLSSNITGIAGDGVNYGSATQPMRIDVQGILSGDTISYMPSKVKANGGKIKTVKNCPGLYYIYPNKAETKITITAGSKKAEFTIKNASLSKDKTKITASNVYKVNGKDAKGKVFSNLNFGGFNTDMFTVYNKLSVNMVEYSITGASPSTNNVMVEMVSTKKNEESVEEIKGAIADNDGVDKRGNCLLIPVKDNKFRIDYAWKWNEKKYATLNIKPGSYTLNVTPVICDELGNVTSATGKTVKLKVKFAKAPKAKVKIGTTFNFGAGGSVSKDGTLSQDIVLNAKNKNFLGDATNIFFDSDGNGNLVRVRGLNKKGKINNFGKNFGVTYNAKDKKFQLGYGASDYFTTDGTEIKASDKAEQTGYIPVTYQQLNGEVATEFVKVKIKLNKGASLTK